MINLPMLQQHITDNISSFIKYWKDYYDESYQRDYFEIIEKVVWDESDIEKRFKWKNNIGKEEKKLGKTRRTYVSRASAHLDWINKSKNSVIVKFKDLGPVWSIFSRGDCQFQKFGEFPAKILLEKIAELCFAG